MHERLDTALDQSATGTTEEDAADELVRYPELSPELEGGFSWGMLKYFGAGAIVASVTIGSGETLFASRGGAVFGYALLWCFVGGALMKGVQVYTSARYMTLTGEHPMAHWKFIPPLAGWVPWMMAVVSLACFPFWLGGLPLLLGKTINWIWGVPPNHEHFLLYSRAWASACIVLAVTLTWLQSYGFLEKAQTVIVGFLLVSILTAALLSDPDWMQMLVGLVPSVPQYDGWIREKYADIATTPPWVEVGIYLGAVGGGTYDYLGYIGCFREKKWGLIGKAPSITKVETLPIDGTPENIRRGLQWLWPARIDVWAGFACVLVFTLCFVSLGATILRPEETIPEGNDLLTHQARFLTQFGPGYLYLYQLGIFFAVWGTIYGAYEIYIRAGRECLNPVSDLVRHVPERKFVAAILLYVGIGGLVLLWLNSDPISIVAPAAIVGGVFLCGPWCFAMIWIDRQFLPRPLQMGWLLLWLNIISGTVLTAIGGLAMYNQWFKSLFE